MSDVYEHKDSWTRRGLNFSIVVEHRELQPSILGLDIHGPHRWNTYAFVYPKHSMFSQFKPNEGIFAQPDLPLHGGCSFVEPHMHKGEIASIQVGSDYNHDHDDHFTRMATREEASRVFADANELFEYLSANHN